MGEEYDELLGIGSMLRHAHIAWVELLSCRVGAGEPGQELLNWLHVLWRVPVRALLGDLVIENNRRFGLSAYVAPVGAGRNARGPRQGGFYTHYARTPPTDMRLWQFSAPTVPAFRPELVVPPMPAP